MIMVNDKPRPTVEELFETLKRTSLPTVLVEGKNDIIFYRDVEEDLRDIGVDMLPAGNKDAVLKLRELLRDQRTGAPIAFVVDNDLWVHTGIPNQDQFEDVITTQGYSIENDLFVDGELLKLLAQAELQAFHAEVQKFCEWYALAVDRYLRNQASPFRTHPGKVLDDRDYYKADLTLKVGEVYPDKLLEAISADFGRVLRGKSLFAILHRQLSRKGRAVKFSESQLMAFGASRRGENFKRIGGLVRERIQSSS